MAGFSYSEEFERARTREIERAMVFAALRKRRARVTPRGVLVSVLRLLGAL